MNILIYNYSPKDIDYAIFCLVYINNICTHARFLIPDIENTGNIYL